MCFCVHVIRQAVQTLQTATFQLKKTKRRYTLSDRPHHQNKHIIIYQPILYIDTYMYSVYERPFLNTRMTDVVSQSSALNFPKHNTH